MSEIAKYCKLRPDGLLEAGAAYLADNNEYASTIEVVGTPDKFSGDEIIAVPASESSAHQFAKLPRENRVKASHNPIKSSNLGTHDRNGQEAAGAQSILRRCDAAFRPT